MEFHDINQELQSYRKKRTIWGCVIPISFVTFFISSIGKVSLIGALSMFVMILSICMMCLYSSKCSKIDSDVFKKYLLPRLHEAFKEFEYNKYQGIDRTIIKNLKFIDSGNRIKISDNIQGYYRDVSFVQSGVLCEYETRDSDGDTHTETTFAGRVIILGVSMFSDEAMIDIISHNNKKTSRKKFPLRKVTLNKEIENYYDIYVSCDGLSLSEKFLDHLTMMAKSFPYYDINVRIEKDRIYIAIGNIERKAYSLESIGKLNKENLDMLIKKDSYFITNTISSILDGEE